MPSACCPDPRHLPPWHPLRWRPAPTEPAARQQVSRDAYLSPDLRRRVLDQVADRLAHDPAVPGRAGQGEDFHEVPGVPHVRIGRHLVLHTQFRLHEHPVIWQTFEEQARAAGITTPRTLDSGWVTTPDGCVWWLVQQRAGGDRDQPGPHGPARAHALGQQLARLHRHAPATGPGLRDRAARQLGYRWLDQHDLELADLVHGLLADIAARDLPQVAVHGDCYRHNNVLFEGPAVAAVLDPHLIRCGPAEFDLAKALAGERDRGGFPDQLLAGYRQAGGPDLDHPTLELAAALHSAQTQVAHSPDPARPAVARQQVEHLRAAVTRWS